MSSSSLAVIILAAGKGSRMQSDLPKVAHPIAGRPMLAHLLAAVRELSPEQVAIVLGNGMSALEAMSAPAIPVIQDPPRGTGDAVRQACRVLAEGLVPSGTVTDVLVLFGDTPLLTAATMRRLVEERRREPAAAVVVSAMRPADPGRYGRLVLGDEGTLERIVEARDATPEELRIPLCNGGIMAIAAEHLAPLVEALRPDNAQNEFYLTDIVGIAHRQGLVCRVFEMSPDDLLGINTRAELAAAEAQIQGRLRAAAMASGATLVAPETVFLSADTQLGRDVLIEPNVFFGPGVRVGDGARIRAFSHIEGAEIGPGAIVGPFARLRPGAVLEMAAHIGNFVEVKAARIGAGAKANHLAYIGDSDIGAGANIGAGTITCNYDGFRKSRTRIGANAFIGSNTALVAPVSVGDRAIVAAGSVVTSDVPADALSVGRGRQVDKPGRAKQIRATLKGSGAVEGRVEASKGGNGSVEGQR